MKAIWVPSYTVNYTHTQRVTICCHNTDLVHVNGHDRIILVIFSQAQGSLMMDLLWSETCWSTFKYFIILIVSTVVKVLCYKSEGRWFDPIWCQWIFYLYKILQIALWPWGRLGLQQKWASGVFPGVKGGRCVRLTTLPPSCAVVTKSGNLNFLGPSESVHAWYGTALPLHIIYCALVGYKVFNCHWCTVQTWRLSKILLNIYKPPSLYVLKPPLKAVVHRMANS